MGELYLELDERNGRKHCSPGCRASAPPAARSYDTLKESVDRYKAARGG